MKIEEIQRSALAELSPDTIRSFDMYNVPAGQRDFMETVAALAKEGPKVFFTEQNGGHWVIADYDLVAAAAKDTVTFSSFPYTIPTYIDETPIAPLLLDPPEHTTYRSILNKLFTPRAAKELTEEIRASAVELITKVADGDHCDFLESIAELLPVSIFLRMLGLPLERLHEYRHAVATYLGSADLESKREMAEWIIGELSRAIADRRVTPGDDLISKIVASEIEGRPLSDDEAINLCMMIFVAGLDTVTVSMSYGIRHLAEDQDLQAWARAHPERITDLTEELLRRYSAAQPGRTATRDISVGGAEIKTGDRVLLLIAAANLDAGAFDRPQSVDPDRGKKPHLAFNVGPHRCVGMHLARFELQIVYEEWLKRIPAFRLDAAVPFAASGGHVLSLKSLGLRWD